MATIINSTGHGLLTGQTVVITGTENYDGQYDITAIDDDSFSIDVDFIENETGECYPLMDGKYYITFLFDIEDLFDEIKLKTAYKAKSLKSERGISEEIPFTEDRRDVFLLLLKAGAGELFKKIHAYSKGIINAFKFNERIDLEGDGIFSTEYYVHFTINEDKDYQDENVYQLLDSKLKEAMIAYVLKEWYQLASLMQDFQIQQMKYDELIGEVRSAAMQAEGKKPIIMNEGIR